MLVHLILGLLRDGQARHGYQLVTQHRALTGTTISPGNVYRELSRLSATRLVRPVADLAVGDARRIRYHITDPGRELFDSWLCSPSKHEGELGTWLIFLDRVPPDVRERVLDRARDALWSQSKALERAREDALARLGAAPGRYDPLPVLLLGRLKQVSASLEFLNELRIELGTDPMPVDWEVSAAGAEPGAEAERPTRRGLS